MKIAVTSQNFQTVTGHAGRARRFLIYDVQPTAEPVEIARLDLAPEQSIHEMGGAGAHPVDSCDALLSAGFASHFATVMAARGIQAAITDKLDPVEAIKDFLARRAAGTLLPSGGCDCGGECKDHDHDHAEQETV